MIISGKHFVELVKRDTELSKSLIPNLLYRLVRESTDNNTFIHFPKGDDIFAPGWDGFVYDNKTEHRFLPMGKVYFEVGTNSSCYNGLKKINADYEKRKSIKTIAKKEESTYIAVTTSILNSTKKEELTTRYNAEHIFERVIILDAIDITDWMEENINICIWFLKEYGEKIDDYDITLLPDEWDRISLCTEPVLSFDFFKAGNERNAKKLIEDLQKIKSNKSITISSRYYGKDFAFFFCVATLMESDERLKERTIIINSQSAMNYVNASCSGKIVLVNFNCTDDRFIVNMNNIYIFFDSLFGAGIKLDMIQQNDFVEEVVKLGLSKQEARRISFIVDYSPLALRRFLAKIPSIKVPVWSRNRDKNELIPLLLLGEIDMGNVGSIEFIRAIVGTYTDTYIEKLNIWSEINDSPVLKYETIYKMCARRECFDFLQVDIFSIKLKKVEEQLIKALTEVDGRIKKENEGMFIFNSDYKWDFKTIENILNGFIILSEQNKKNQIHFDIFVKDILSKLYGNYELSLTVSRYFNLLVELSPNAFLIYLQTSVYEDKDNFLKFINTSTHYFFVNNQYDISILNALGVLLRKESISLDALELLIDIYYLTDDNKNVLDKLKNTLRPFSTMNGSVVIPLSQKIDFFLNYIEKKSVKKSLVIVRELYENFKKGITACVSFSYKDPYSKEIKVTYDEICENELKLFTWLNEHEENSKDLILTLKHVLQSINETSFQDIQDRLKIIEGRVLAENDEIKALACKEILIKRESIIKRPNLKKYQIYLPVFEEIVRNIQPKDIYIATKYILLDNDYPLINPPSFDENDWYEKTLELRKKEKENQLIELLRIEGKGVISKLIEDSRDNHGIIWSILYKYSDDRFKDIQSLVNKNYLNALKEYLLCFDEKEIDKILEQYSSEIIIIRALPYSRKTYLWIDGNKNEKEYWQNHYFNYSNEEDLPYLFDKYLVFAPEKLIDVYPFFIDRNYEYGIRLLKAIVALLEEDENQKLKSKVDLVQDIVNRMDSMYYTEELSICKFQLLPILTCGIEDYPMGIKKYFWDNPEQFRDLFVQLSEKIDSLESNSMGKKMFIEAKYSFSNGCYIPNEYLSQRKSEIKNWVEKVLNCSETRSDNEKEILVRAVTNTLACCPKSLNDKIWPIKEIADVLEEIALMINDNKYEVSKIFALSYLNRIGVRTITDGSPEYLLGEEFENYQKYYQFSHPITRKALEIISSSFNRDAEDDKRYALIGN